MVYKAKNIADYFLFKGKDDDTMTPMKLMKLVYIAHGWSLGLGKLLIDENAEAWAIWSSNS